MCGQAIGTMVARFAPMRLGEATEQGQDLVATLLFVSIEGTGASSRIYWGSKVGNRFTRACFAPRRKAPPTSNKATTPTRFALLAFFGTLRVPENLNNTVQNVPWRLFSGCFWKVPYIATNLVV